VTVAEAAALGVVAVFAALACWLAVKARHRAEGRTSRPVGRHAAEVPLDPDAGYLDLSRYLAPEDPPPVTIQSFDPDERDPGDPVTEPTSLAELIAYAAHRAELAEAERDHALERLADTARDLEALDALARGLFIAGGEVLRGESVGLLRPAIAAYRAWWVRREGR